MQARRFSSCVDIILASIYLAITLLARYQSSDHFVPDLKLDCLSLGLYFTLGLTLDNILRFVSVVTDINDSNI